MIVVMSGMTEPENQTELLKCESQFLWNNPKVNLLIFSATFNGTSWFLSENGVGTVDSLHPGWINSEQCGPKGLERLMFTMCL